MSGDRNGTRLAPGHVNFTFDGRDVRGREGDTVASALLAQGVRLMARSVKYRRARGVFSAGIEEPNALFTVGDAPNVLSNVPGSRLVLAEGLVVRSQNRWPSLRYDVNSLLQLGGGLFSAGFYYKTFMWPSWHAYEGMIRRLAGLGEAPGRADLPPVDVEHLSTDVLVAGAGPSGLSAALAAARAGARVVLCEREPHCGGELEFETASFAGTGEHAPVHSGRQWVETVLRELNERRVRVLTDTAVVGGSNGLMIAHRQRGGLAGADALYRIRPRAFVMASGALERPIAFVNNDLPGIMLLGAAERYLARYGVRVGTRVVLFGNHDRLYASAVRLLRGGVRIAMIVDTRTEAQTQSAAAARDALRREAIECVSGHALCQAHGRLAVRGATIVSLGAAHTSRQVACDAILVSGGWSPQIHPGLQEGGSRAFVAEHAAFIAADQPEHRSACGACDGAFELNEVIAMGAAAGVRAAGAPAGAGIESALTSDAAPRLVPFWRSPATLAAEKKQFVDLQNDVTVADLRQALEEGFTDIEHIKRYTTLGVGTEQGKTSGVLGAAIAAELSGNVLEAVGTSRARPPFQPVTLQSLVGARDALALRPLRRTPVHAWHVAQGGVLENAGLWVRPRFYRTHGSDAFAAGIAEARRVREHGGIFDGSTLGKIEVVGADAPAFLDRLYLNRASTIKIGRSKYMVNLREDGMVLDDGIVLRLAEDRFLATVSSSHAGLMLSHFEFWRDAHHTPYAVALTDVTEAWAVIVVAGPQSRRVLNEVLGAAGAPVDSLTHMAFAECHWGGCMLRILRASFSGELAFELHCRPGHALALWEALHAKGLQPYGLEAADILRVEKGYLVSSELNGQSAPADLNMEGLLRQGNPCIGRELLERPAFAHPERPRLVGLAPREASAVLSAGAQLTDTAASTHSLGYITSAVMSPAVGRWIGLAFVARHRAAEGTMLLARDPLRGRDVPVVIVPAVHFDPAGERMRA